MALNKENQELRMQRIADGGQELPWQLGFEESAVYCSPFLREGEAVHRQGYLKRDNPEDVIVSK